MARILVTTLPHEGHLNPTFSISHELKANGHEVIYLDHPFIKPVLWRDQSFCGSGEGAGLSKGCALPGGRKLGVPLATCPPVARHPGAAPAIQNAGNGTGLHWQALHEDISVESLLKRIGDQTQNHFAGGLEADYR